MNYDKLPYLMTRREVADLIGMSESFIRDNESMLGLDRARVRWSSNRVRFIRDAVIASVELIRVRNDDKSRIA